MPFKRRVAPAGARTLPSTAVQRATVVAHLGRFSRHTIMFLDIQLMSAGATNSGKTYNALQFLLQRAQASLASKDGVSSAAGAFVYAGLWRAKCMMSFASTCLRNLWD